MSEKLSITTTLLDPTSKLKEVKRVLWLILVLNWLVAFAKIGYGFRSNTLSMTADGFHSLLDGTSNIVGLIAVTIAVRPPDSDHPYGHRKFETVAAMMISMFLFMTAYEILTNAIDRFKNPGVEAILITPVSFAIMGVTIIINIFVTLYERRKAKQLKSEILLADSMHTLSDVYASLSVIVALVAIQLGFSMADVVVALLIVFLIARAAFSIVYQALSTLADESRVDPLKVEETVMAIPGVVTCHHIRSRGIPDAINVDFHITLDPALPLAEAHRITHEAMDRVKRAIPGVTDVVIHTEPTHGPDHDRG